MKYDLSRIMQRAWRNFRKGGLSFSEALHRAWLSAKAEPINAARIAAAKAAAGIMEAVNTWIEWRRQGFEVIHGGEFVKSFGIAKFSPFGTNIAWQCFLGKALFGVDLIHGSKGDGAIYKARFFGASQVKEIAA